LPTNKSAKDIKTEMHMHKIASKQKVPPAVNDA